MRVFHTQALRFLIHQLGKSLFRTRNNLRQRNTGIVTGLHNHAANQLIDRYVLIRLNKHTGTDHAPGIRIPQFPDEEIERLLASVSDPANLSDNLEDDENAKLRAMRDRAFLLTLADTGLRVHEACKLRRGDMNWNEGYAVIIGKGDKQAVVRFTSRSLRAIKDYLSLRASLDGNSGKRLASLPVFARHDKGSGGKVKPMTPTTGRNIVKERVTQLLGKELADQITPHTFRHYFVTAVLRGTGNLRYAQELARHKNIQVTERYTHLANEELDKAYYDVFERESE